VKNDNKERKCVVLYRSQQDAGWYIQYSNIAQLPQAIIDSSCISDTSTRETYYSNFIARQ